MFYYAIFDYADDGITVTFPDIPEAITCGQSTAEAMEMAEDALLTVVEIYFDDGRPFPLARPPRAGETAVPMPTSVYAKILLHNKMLEQRVSKSELARLADIAPAEMTRITDIRHSTKIDTIARLLELLGSPLHISA